MHVWLLAAGSPVAFGINSRFRTVDSGGCVCNYTASSFRPADSHLDGETAVLTIRRVHILAVQALGQF